MVPAYTLPPNAEDVKMMRALVKETLSREQVDRLADDIAEPARRWRRRAAPTLRAQKKKQHPRPHPTPPPQQDNPPPHFPLQPPTTTPPPPPAVPNHRNHAPTGRPSLSETAIATSESPPR